MKFLVLVSVAVLSLPLLAHPAQSASREEVKAIQLTLKQQGYSPGPIDGILGSKTTKALREFQKDKKLPVTGKIDEATTKLLQAATGAPSAPTNLRVVQIKAE